MASNLAAGSIIGKGGSTINEFQTITGARIQLSRNHEFFPGTSDRIIMVSGTFDEIMRAMELIIEKLSHEVLLLMSPFRLVFFFFFSQKPVSFDSLFDLYCLLTLNFGWFV